MKEPIKLGGPCPHCGVAITASEIGKLYAGLRKNRRGGRPWPKKVPVLCDCGYPAGSHHPECDKYKPPRLKPDNGLAAINAACYVPPSKR